MFIRTQTNGTRTYVLLVENERIKGRLVQRVLHRLGRLDDLQASGQLDTPVARAIFLTVLHRLMAPGATARWSAGATTAPSRADGLELHQLYRAMAWLGAPLPKAAATPFAPRTTKDLVEEALFASARPLQPAGCGVLRRQRADRAGRDSPRPQFAEGHRGAVPALREARQKAARDGREVGMLLDKAGYHPPMTRDELRARADALRWYHTIDLGLGVVTRGMDSSPERLARVRLPDSLSGLSVLDMGAWDGFFSFEAERRNARRVVASDYYAWHGTGWATGQGKAGFQLARAALNSRVEDLDLDVMDLAPERVGAFDVVLFLGVLYHLPNPLLALERVASVTKDLLILETVVDMVGVPRPAAAFYPGRELNGDPTNWWGPNHAAVVGMLQSVGFTRIDVVTPVRNVGYRTARAVAHCLRGKNTFGAALRQDRAAFHAYKR